MALDFSDQADPLGEDDTVTVERGGQHFVVPKVVGGTKVSDEDAGLAWYDGKNSAITPGFPTPEAARAAARSVTTPKLDFSAAAVPFEPLNAAKPAPVEEPTSQEAVYDAMGNVAVPAAPTVEPPRTGSVTDMLPLGQRQGPPIRPEVQQGLELAASTDPNVRARLMTDPGYMGQSTRLNAAGNEARRSSLYDLAIQRGASPDAARKWADYNAVLPSDQTQAGPTKFDFDAASQYQDANVATRALKKTVETAKQQAGGFVEAVMDMAGADSSKAADLNAQYQRTLDAMGDSRRGAGYLEQQLEGALVSIGTQGPQMFYATLGAPAAASLGLGALFVQQAGQEYTQGKQQGLEPKDALERAAFYGTAEVVGEVAGIPAARIFARHLLEGGVPTKALMHDFADYLITEQGGEQLTSALEFGYDRFAEHGLNKDSTLEDYLNVVRDTAVQTTMQTLITGAAGHAARVLSGQTGTAQRAAEAANAADEARTAALDKWQAFNELLKIPPKARPDFSYDAQAQGQRADDRAEPPAPAGPAPAITLPGEVAPAPDARIAVDRPDARAQYADVLAKSQRGELLSSYERTVLDNPPETPALELAPASSSRSPFLGDIALMQQHGIGMADWLGQGDLLGRHYTPETVDLMSRLAHLSVTDPEGAAHAIAMIEQFNPHAEVQGEEQGPEIQPQTAPVAGSERGGEEIAAAPAAPSEAAVAAASPAADRTAAPLEPDERLAAANRAAAAAALDQEPIDFSHLAVPLVDHEAHQAATSPENTRPEPTEAQKEAGNYQKGHVTISGLPISIENPAGSKRRPQWPALKSHYGYIRGTVGRDKDHVDIFVKPGTPTNYTGPIYVVDQTKAGGRGFDEHKVVLGASSVDEARQLYRENYTRGWKIGPITEMPMEEFRAWTKSGFTKRPISGLSRAERETLAPKLTPQEVEEIQGLEYEIGWAEEGGRMIRAVDTGGEKPEVVGRTSWIPKSDFWPGRPAGVTAANAKSAIRKIGAGERLSAAEKRFIDYAKEYLARKPRVEQDLRDEMSALDVAKMTPEQKTAEIERLRKELGTDPLTGLGNRRAYGLTPKRAIQVSIDADNLKWINDNMGHASGDRLLKAIGQALGEHVPEGDAFHPSGDEFIAQFDTEEQAVRAMFLANERLAEAKITVVLADGTRIEKTGVGFSYGIGETLEKADQDLLDSKRWGLEQGRRVPSGQEPGNVSRHPPGEAGGDVRGTAAQREVVASASRSETPAEAGVSTSEPQALDLKGETEGEIRTREAEQAKAAADAKKRDNAPAPEGFTLTGSDRAADVARAHGQQELVAAAEAVKPEPPKTPIDSIPAGATQSEAGAVARITDFGEKIGGSRKDVAKPLGPRSSIAKEEDDRPGWARKYHAMQITPGRFTKPEYVGKWQLMKESGGAKGSVKPVNHRQFFDTEAEAVATIPLAEVARNHRVYGYRDDQGATRYGIFRQFGDRKRAMVKGGFESEDAAMRAMVTDPASIIEHKFAFPERPWLDNILRVGPTDRTGDVTPEMFQETFGFRGGEFGNWNMGGDGQAALNHAYDALLDLAHSIGVPPKALSLNGDLAIAFGARGHGGKDSSAAHYEPALRVINLTKIKGAGSLAHEWFHALDHYLGQQAGKTGESASDSMLTYGPGYRGNEARPELLKAFRAVVDTMTAKVEGRAIEEEGAKRGLARAQESVRGKLDQLRSYIARTREWGSKKAAATPAQLAAWDALAERALNGDNGKDVRVEGKGRMAIGFPSSEVVRGLNDIYKQVTGRSFDNADQGSDGRTLYWGIRSLGDMNARVAKAQEGAIEQRRTGTNFFAEAKNIDGYRASDYWSTPHEMGARAFESYIFDKLAGQERPSQYLVHAVENKYYALLGMKPYPEGEERAAINRAFEDLFKAIQTKETDRGTAMFARSEPARGPLSVQDVRSTIEPIVAKWVNPPDVKVLKSLSEAPLAVRGHDQTQRAQGALGEPYAFFHEGTVYLVADQIRSPEEAVIGLFHEALGHYGLRGVFGAALERELAGVAASRPSDVKALAKSYGLDPLVREDRLVAAEEVLAHMAQERPELGVVQRVIAAIRNWLRAHGMSLEWTDNDIIQHFIIPARRFVEEGRGAGPLEGRAAFARTGGITTPTKAQPGSWNAPGTSKMDDVIYTLQNKHIDTKRVVDTIAKQVAGNQLADAEDPYLQEELYHGRAAKAVTDFLDDELKPLLKDMAARGVNIPEFEEWLHARHAEERNVQIAKINPNLPDGGSGMTTAQAKTVVAQARQSGKAPTYQALAKQIDAITAKTRALFVSYGLEAPSTVAAWQSTYQHYVPLQREDMEGGMGTGQGFSVRGNATKRATGSTRGVVDILANIAMQRERVIGRGEKTRVARALLGLAQQNPNADFWRIDQPPMVSRVDPRTGLVTRSVDPLYKSRDNVIVVPVPDGNGNVVDHAVVFNEHDSRAMRMAKALKNVDTAQLEGFYALAGRFTRYFAAINTQWNPVFGVVNITRDTQDAMLNLTTTPIAGHQAEVLKHIPTALRGVYSDLREMRAGGHATSSWGQLFEEFQNEGGKTAYRDMYATSEEREKAIEAELARFGQATWRKDKAVVEAVAGWLSDYNEAMENAVRLSAYKVGLDHGLSKQRAASVAKNLTVNFNRKGAATPQMASLYAFFNASVQGTTRTLQTLAGPKGKQIIAGGVLVGVLQALALAAAGFDDDEPPEWEKEKNLIIPIGGKKYVKIVMPQGFLVLPNVGRLATEYMLSGFKGMGKKITDLIGTVMDAANPIGNAGWSAQTLAPTALDPFVALAENKDWTGRPIAREDMSRLHPTPGFKRSKDVASPPAKWAAQAINAMSGGTAFKPGAFSPTADQIDYLTGQFAGGVGREITHAAQTAASLISGEKLPPYKVPLLGRMYGDADTPAAVSNRFYENLTEINAHGAEIKGRHESHEPTADYYRENPEAKLAPDAHQVERDISQLRKQKSKALERGAPKEIVQDYDDKMAAKMQRFNDAVKRAKGG